MNKIVKFSLTLLAAGVISACGSSGGGDNNSSPSATNNTPNTSSPSTNQKPNNNTSNQNNSGNNSANKPATPPPNKVNSSDDMGTAFRTKDSKEFDIKKADTHREILEVDGKKLPVAFPGIYSGSFTNLKAATINGISYKGFTVSGSRYSNVRFGHVDGYVFAQGNVTPESSIPKSGVATYNVDAVFVQNGQASISENHKLNIDFANKTVNGDVAPNVKVTNAKIDGNEFDGKAVHNGKSAELEGRFYGSNASEIGGAYSSSSFSGAFGGKKQ